MLDDEAPVNLNLTEPYHGPARPPMNAKQRRLAEAIINGDVVRRRRKALNLTQTELAIMASTTVRLISRIERGVALDPPTSVTLRLAKSLSVTCEALCSGSLPYTSR